MGLQIVQRPIYLITKQYTIPQRITQAFALVMNLAKKPCPCWLGEWELGVRMPHSLIQSSDLCLVTQVAEDVKKQVMF